MMGSVPEPSSNPTNETTATPAMHDGRGKFAKGNPGGPGNPHGKRIAEYRRQLFDTITPEMARALVKQQYQLAITGDVDAAKLIWPYIFGRVPVEDAEVMPNGDGSVTIRFIPAQAALREAQPALRGAGEGQAPFIGPALPPPEKS